MYPDHEGRMHYNGPYPKALTEKEYAKVDENLLKYFTEKIHVSTSRWGGQIHTTRTYLLNIPEYYIGIKIKKRMLTMVKDLDPELLREEAWVDDKLAPYYLSAPGSNAHKWSWSDYNTKKDRRHVKDAITHVMNGEIETPLQYKKLRHKL